MKTFSIAVTAAAVALASGLLSAAPAGAVDGATALDMCKKLAHCISSVSSKGDVLIMTNEGDGITCPSLTEQCLVAWNVAVPPGGGTYQPPPSLSGSESSDDDEVAATPAEPEPAPGPGPIL